MQRVDLLGAQFECECGRRHGVPTRRFVVERGAVALVPEVLRDFGLAGKVFLLVDPTTYEAAGRSVERALKGAGIAVHLCMLPEKPKAGDEMLRFVDEAYVPSAVIISCGSGTVTDLGKYLANGKGLPCIAVATASSMNGYASSIVALMRNGVKVAEPVKPALAVVADIDVMVKASLEMTRAGLGDAVAKPVCNADWKLAHIMRGRHFCKLAFDLIKDLEPIYLGRADEIAKREPEAVTALTEALLYSGITMELAGSSAPTSGGEHLISHTLDMRAAFKGRSADLHGAQVGVAALLTAHIYERLLDLSADDVGRMWYDRGARSTEDDERRVRGFFGPVAQSVLETFAAKARTVEERAEDREMLLMRWDEICSEVRSSLMTPAELRCVLDAAGCRADCAALGLDTEEFREAAYLARTIRPRYNVLDLAWELGLLEDCIREAT